jgi:hypothetical protein
VIHLLLADTLKWMEVLKMRSDTDMKIDKMGVAVLMSHLIITLAVLAIYAVSSYNGKLDDTIRTVLTVIIGYWFGAIGAMQ